MKTLKDFFSSKINWTAIILILVSLQDFITTFDFSAMTVKGWVTFGIGLLIIVFRTWFTATTAKTNEGEAPKQ